MALNWDTILWGNTLAAYAYTLGMATLVTLLIVMVVRVYSWRMQKTGQKGRLPFYLLWHALQSTKWWLIFPLALILTSVNLSLPLSVYPWLRSIFVTLFIVQVIYWGNRALMAWGDRYEPEQAADMGARYTSIKMFLFFGRLFFFVICFLVIVDSLPGIEITALVASLGIGGIAVALAIQNILSDIFASLTITLDKPFVLGDFIIVGDMMGAVENIGLKTTRIRSLSGEQLVFSNNDLLSSRIRNFKRMYQRRVPFKIGITFDTPLEKIRKIPPKIKEIIESLPDTRFDRAHFQAHGAHSLDFEIVYYVDGPDFNRYMDRQQAINLAIHEFFLEEGIEFAFPTQTIYLKQDAPMIEGALRAVTQPGDGEQAAPDSSR